MKTFLVFVLGLIIGGVGGLFGGGLLGVGLGTGAGVATGLQAGACMAVEAARENGMISSEQIGEVFAAIGESMKAQIDLSGIDLADSDAECRQVVADIKAAAEAEGSAE
jgi:hypothetical protein